MTGYENAPEPGFGDNELTSDQCFARARRALERAEVAVDKLAEVARAHRIPGQVDPETDFLIISERAYIGNAWTALGAALDAQRRQR